MIANGHFIIIANIVLLCEDVLSYLILNDLQQSNNFMTKFGQNSPFSDTNCVWSLTAYSQGENVTSWCRWNLISHVWSIYMNIGVTETVNRVTVLEYHWIAYA